MYDPSGYLTPVRWEKRGSHFKFKGSENRHFDDEGTRNDKTESLIETLFESRLGIAKRFDNDRQFQSV